MIWIICGALTLATLVYVFYLPGRLFLGPEKTRAGYLRERKDAVYENLRDLNFEYKAGKRNPRPSSRETAKPPHWVRDRSGNCRDQTVCVKGQPPVHSR